MKSSKQDGKSMESSQKDDDFVRFNHKGKMYVLPRWMYEKPLTDEDHARTGLNRGTKTTTANCFNKFGTPTATAQQPIKKTPRQNLISNEESSSPEWRKQIEKSQAYLDQLANSFSKSMVNQNEPTHSQKQDAVVAPEEEEHKLEHIYTLENMVESRETVIEQPVRKLRSLESKIAFEDFPEPNTCKSTATLAANSAESLDSKKCLEATEKLCELKTAVISLIDQAINKLDTEEHLGYDAALHPSGDGSKQIHRVQNLQILKTDSFAHNRIEIKKKLYAEIEQLIGRLKDIDLLEKNS